MARYFLHISLNDPVDPDLTYDTHWSEAFLNLCTNSGITELFKRDNIKVAYIDINSFSHWILYQPDGKKYVNFKNLFNIAFDKLDFREYKFVISFIGEARAYYEADMVAHLLKKCGVLDDQIHIMLSTIKECAGDYKCVSFWEYFLRNPFGTGDFEQYLEDMKKPEYNHRETIPQKHFLCLMRRVKVDRALFFNQMVEFSWFRNKKVIDISLGSVGDPGEHDMGPHKNLLKDGVMRMLPIAWDTYPVDDDAQHQFLRTSNINQLVNVVVETFIITNQFHYDGLFITEKSVKPFFYYQMPLFVAQKGIVKQIRKLGYDVFDDYFENHYYDDIDDNFVRMNEVLKIMDRFVKKYPQEELANIKKSIITRLDRNLMLIRRFSEREYYKIFNKKMRDLVGYKPLL